MLQVGGKPPRTFKYIDWDHFRKIRKERGGDSPENFQEWLDRVKRDVEEATKLIDTELEAKESLLARWRTQKLNCRLRKRLAELNKAIIAHCQVLERQQWHELCNIVDGQMRIGAKYNMLKHLFHENKTKINQNRLALGTVPYMPLFNRTLMRTEHCLRVITLFVSSSSGSRDPRHS
ncbi:hypothetical protein HPB50_013093 [Hyalomma asiaticum]|uniref:Uncharacterized protein n=1 Tax=Hyalomma asiaticum TaxID=266040 RepID=A0ACB7SQ59_HYAAI|nr:hypothetical protein HPB50_013093 [Hyalomma asiaticum]